MAYSPSLSRAQLESLALRFREYANTLNGPDRTLLFNNGHAECGALAQEAAQHLRNLAVKVEEEAQRAPAPEAEPEVEEDGESDEEALRFFAAAGFELWETGGGCTAFGKELPGCTGAYVLITNEDGSSHPLDHDASLLVGLHDQNGFVADGGHVEGWQAALDAAQEVVAKHHKPTVETVRDEKMLEAFGLAGFGFWHTGGNCTAFARPIEDEGNGAYILVTQVDEALHPFDDTSEVAVGFYDSGAFCEGVSRIVDISGPGGVERAVIAADELTAKLLPFSRLQEDAETDDDWWKPKAESMFKLFGFGRCEGRDGGTYWMKALDDLVHIFIHVDQNPPQHHFAQLLPRDYQPMVVRCQGNSAFEEFLRQRNDAYEAGGNTEAKCHDLARVLDAVSYFESLHVIWRMSEEG